MRENKLTIKTIALIAVMTANPVISTFGACIGRGTIISLILVMGVLPQLLVLGDILIERTSFRMPQLDRKTRSASGTLRVRGRVRGYISGMVDAEINGEVTGQINASVSAGNLEIVGEDPAAEGGSDA